MPLKLEILTPERRVYEDEVDMVIAPGSEGYLGILPNHAPLITELASGELRVKKGSTEQILAVFGGLMDVRDNRVSVLTEAAENSDEIDDQRAQAARENAQKALAVAVASTDPAAEARARASLERALVRLRVSERKRRRL
ncbi:MAG: F0F1 ATP synthase subunit epsilon [Chloroflexi bacterium]|nr:F0F1 ATP synthase subunit epsilon [Chloroflexota bacterium]